MAYKSQTRERCQVSAVLIVRENNCERAWVSATLGCRAVRGVTSQLGRQGSGASSAGERLRHPTNDRMAPLCQQADGPQPLTWQLDTYRGSEAFLWADWVRQEGWMEWVRHCSPFWGFQGFPSHSVGNAAVSPWVTYFWWSLRCPRLLSGVQCRVKANRGWKAGQVG